MLTGLGHDWPLLAGLLVVVTASYLALIAYALVALS
jgi:hypothetical protein